MAVFAIGTMPGLLALAGLPMFASGERRAKVLAVVGVALMVFAVVNLSSAAGLLGLTSPQGAAVTATGVSANVSLENGVQVVRMDQTARGYQPDSTVVYAGVPIRWVINSESEYTCASYLREVGSDWKVNLKTGENTVELPAVAAGPVLRLHLRDGDVLRLARRRPRAEERLTASPVVGYAGGCRLIGP